MMDYFKRFLLALQMLIPGCLLADELKIEQGKPSHIGMFMSLDRIAGEYPSTAVLSYDKDNLYIRTTEEVRNSEAVSLKKGKGPYAIFAGNTAEIFLSPKPESGTYYQLAVSPDNAVYMAEGGNFNWKPKYPIQTKTQISKHCWTAEFKIPFAALGVQTPVKGEQWRVNIVMGKSWAAISDMHDISQFNTITFGEKQCGLFLEKLIFQNGAFYVKISDAGQSEKCSYTIVHEGMPNEVSIHDKVPKEYKIDIPKSLYHKEIRTIKAVISNNGKTEVYRLSAPLAKDNAVRLNKFYYSQNDILSFSFPEPVYKVKIDSADDVDSFTLSSDMPFKEIPLGNKRKTDYKFSVLDSKTDRILAQTAFVILDEIKTPRQDGKFISGEIGVKDDYVTVNGKPFYPIVLFGSASAAEYPSLQIYHSMKSGYSDSGFIYPADENEHLSVMQKNADAQKLTENAGIFRLQYESQMNMLIKNADGKAEISKNPIEYFSRVYRLFKKMRPNAVFSIHADGAADRKKRGQCCDIFEFASWSSSYAPAMMPNMDDEIQLLKMDVPDKPIFFWLGGTMGGKSNRTPDEIRAGVYLSLLRRCAGNCIHLGHGGDPKKTPDLWSLVNGIQREINQFYPEYIAGKDVSSLFTVYVKDSNNMPSSDSNGIVYSAKEANNGEILLIVLNTHAVQHTVFILGKQGCYPFYTLQPYQPLVARLNHKGINIK